MNITIRYIHHLLSLVSFISLLGLTIVAEAKPNLNNAIKRQEIRNEFTKFETIIDSLNITQGMSILDIGSGPGYASFIFAEKLKSSGEVYATDIREDFVNHIAKEGKKRGLTNLHSTVVKEVGFDDFYLKHHYDLVFMSNVYHCIDNRIEYFSKLRSLLKSNARLVVVLYNQVPLFSVDDISNIDEIVTILSKEADNSPFVKPLSATTKQLIKNMDKTEALEIALVDDFNKMLIDPQFYNNFYSKSFFIKDFFAPPERDFANWLLMSLKEEGVLERPVDQINAKDMRTVIKLNRLFFIKRFGEYFERKGYGAYVPAGDANRHTSKYVMFRELDAAGYTLLKEIKLSPLYDAVIMVPKSQ